MSPTVAEIFHNKLLQNDPCINDILSKLHTKQLLQMLTGLRTVSGCSDEVITQAKHEVTRVLNTRPHVMNKKESRANRLAKIKQGK